MRSTVVNGLWLYRHAEYYPKNFMLESYEELREWFAARRFIVYEDGQIDTEEGFHFDYWEDAPEIKALFERKPVTEKEFNFIVDAIMTTSAAKLQFYRDSDGKIGVFEFSDWNSYSPSPNVFLTIRLHPEEELNRAEVEAWVRRRLSEGGYYERD